jgi:hypothetical protein
VPVLSHGKGGHLAVGAPGHDHRELAVQLQPSLQHAWNAAEAVERPHRVLSGNDRSLALAIVSQPARLEQRRALDGRQRAREVGFVSHDSKRSGGKAMTLEEGLFRAAVLGNSDRLDRRPDEG